MGGDLIVAPAILIAANYRRYRQLPGRPFEAVILIAALTGVSVLVFSHPTNVVYSLFPLLIWAALRFWQAWGGRGEPADRHGSGGVHGTREGTVCDEQPGTTVCCWHRRSWPC